MKKVHLITEQAQKSRKRQIWKENSVLNKLENRIHGLIKFLFVKSKSKGMKPFFKIQKMKNQGEKLMRWG